MEPQIQYEDQIRILQEENRKLRRNERWVTVYLIVSIIVQLYDIIMK
jgi:hypothetical protein